LFWGLVLLSSSNSPEETNGLVRQGDDGEISIRLPRDTHGVHENHAVATALVIQLGDLLALIVAAHGLSLALPARLRRARVLRYSPWSLGVEAMWTTAPIGEVSRTWPLFVRLSRQSGNSRCRRTAMAQPVLLFAMVTAPIFTGTAGPAP
jgi:hypothetical protein